MIDARPTVASERGVAIDPDLLERLERQLAVDTSETQPVHLLIGRNGSRIRLSPSAVQLLRQVSRGTSFEQLAEALSRRDSRAVSPADVESSYRKVIDQIAVIEARDDGVRGAFWFRKAILPARTVDWIARGCSAAFHPVAASLLAATAIAVLAIGMRSGANLGAASFWPAYALFLASLVAHEVGHASACARHGARPSEIGVALYVIYPVFYSNVSDAWTLKRWQRVIVDVGGVYFQLIIGAVYLCAHALCGWEPLRFAVVLILASCLLSLNPILKFDGYWVVADALGVTNLADQPARLVRHFLARLRGQAPPALPWSSRITALLGLYSLLTIGFWVWFLWRVFPDLIRHAIHALHIVIAMVTRPDGQMLRDGTIAVYVLLLVVLVGGRLVRRLAPMVRRRRVKVAG